MFGLFICSYDYYEWIELVCIANTEEELLKHEKTNNSIIVTTSPDAHESLKGKEEWHYYITEIKNISG